MSCKKCQIFYALKKGSDFISEMLSVRSCFLMKITFSALIWYLDGQNQITDRGGYFIQFVLKLACETMPSFTLLASIRRHPRFAPGVRALSSRFEFSRVCFLRLRNKVSNGTAENGFYRRGQLPQLKTLLSCYELNFTERKKVQAWHFP